MSQRPHLRGKGESSIVGQVDAVDQSPTVDNPVFSAFTVMLGAIDALPEADRGDVFDLLKALRATADPEELGSVRRAIREILAQEPATFTPLDPANPEPTGDRLRAWSEEVAGRVKVLRDQKGWDVLSLAERAGLPACLPAGGLHRAAGADRIQPVEPRPNEDRRGVER